MHLIFNCFSILLQDFWYKSICKPKSKVIPFSSESYAFMYAYVSWQLISLFQKCPLIYWGTCLYVHTYVCRYILSECLFILSTSKKEESHDRFVVVFTKTFEIYTSRDSTSFSKRIPMMTHVGFLKEEDIQLSLYPFSYLAAIKMKTRTYPVYFILWLVIIF